MWEVGKSPLKRKGGSHKDNLGNTNWLKGVVKLNHLVFSQVFVRSLFTTACPSWDLEVVLLALQGEPFELAFFQSGFLVGYRVGRTGVVLHPKPGS